MANYGHFLETASSAEQGLAMHATAPYEVVIHDFYLPDMTGIDLCSKLLLDDQALPVVILTEIHGQKLMDDAMNIGISQYVVKDDQAGFLEILPSIVANLLRRASVDGPLPASEKARQYSEERERKLNEARGLFDTLAQKAPIGIFYSGPDGVTRYVNQALVNTTGYSAKELTGSLWDPKIHPEDREAVTARWLSNVDSAEPWHADFRFLKPDGSIAWVIGRTNPQFDSDGKVIGHVGTIVDITERKQTEEQLRKALGELELRVEDRTTKLDESEKRFRDYNEASSDWYWEFDKNLCYSSLSPSTAGEAEYPVSDYLGRSRSEVKPVGIDDDAWAAHMEDLEAHRPFRNFIQPRPLENGRVLWLSVSGTPVFDSDGSFNGYRGTATDITSRVGTQRDLAASTEKLRHAVKLAKLGHYAWDGIEKRAISCTDEYARIHGVSVEEYVSITNSLDALLNWIHPDDREGYLEAIDQAMAKQGDLEHEYRIVTRDGRVRHVHEVFDPTYSDGGQLVQTVGAMHDITERREVEEALKDAERIASIGNWRWSVELNKLTSCSDGYARVLGVSMDDMSDYMARPGFGVVHMDDRVQVDRNFKEAMEKGIDYKIEYRIVRPDDEIRDILEIQEAIVDPNGRCLELTGTIQDITERKSIEREINKAKTEAELANKAKSEFLSSMSHELRTPLNAILGFAQVMEINSKEPLMKSQKSSVDQIVKGGRHLLELITQVLDFAKIETGEINLTIESLELDYAIADCMSIAEALAGPGNIKVIDNISGKGLPPVKADSTRLKQVLLNLISNGVKYNRKGGTLTVEAEVVPENMMRISVTDTGSGINKDWHGRVFDAFDRLGRESLGIEGTGIGLTISKQLVELIDGHISFTSEVNKGSTFWVDLPLADL